MESKFQMHNINFHGSNCLMQFATSLMDTRLAFGA